MFQRNGGCCGHWEHSSVNAAQIAAQCKNDSSIPNPKHWTSQSFWFDPCDVEILEEPIVTDNYNVAINNC